MKLVLIIGAILLGLGGLFLLTTSGDSAASNTPNITMATISNDVASGGQFIDVRTPEEFAAGHIADAANIPLQKFQSGFMLNSAKDKPVYVYCRSGNRSNEAAEILRAAGYQNVIDLGAMTEVQALGGKVTS